MTLLSRRNILIFAGAVILITSASLVAYRVFFLHFVRIPTASMANTIIPGDHLVVKKRAFGEIKRGDIIVFKHVPKSDYRLKYGVQFEYRVARVVGLPGERIQVRGAKVYANNVELRERRVKVLEAERPEDALIEVESAGEGDYTVFYMQDLNHNSVQETPYAGSEPFAVPSEMFFVMGDNRENSEDSRYLGAIARSDIFGKPTMIYWSESPRLDAEDESPRWERFLKRLQ